MKLTNDPACIRERMLPEALRAKAKHPDLAPGTLLQREWRGQTLFVRVLDNGFEYKGQVYKSLSGLAKEITGTKWNGYVLFGLKKQGRGAA